MPDAVKLPIRETAEFLLQNGSIDNRYGGADRALEGARIHRRLQKEAGEGYQAEVSLSWELESGDVRYLLEGRADGVFYDSGLLTVDEIKTTGVPLELIGEDFDAAHWGQARCYAFILCKRLGLEEAAVRLTYYQVDTDEIKRFTHKYPFAGLEAFVQELLAAYRQWALFREGWSKLRTASAKALPFPFPEYRKGQREMAAAVYRTIRDEGRLFCQAPTGIGKTVSALFPSVKAVGEGIAERIFYLTAKTSTQKAAEDAFALMRGNGLRMKTVTITAKDKVCFLEERDCNPAACPYADGYYDRARDGVYSLLETHDDFTRERIGEAAREFRVCPFELSLDLSLWCDAIICDYNYLFDPVSYLKRFFSERRGEHVFLIDEAHNLVDRARDMYSAPLEKSQVMLLKRELGKGSGTLRRSLRELNEELLMARKLCGEQEVLVRLEPEEALGQAVLRFTTAASAWLEEHKERSPLRTQVLELFFEGSFYLQIQELFDAHYRAFYTRRGADITVKLLCLDPSTLLDKRLSMGRSATFFSATLSPLDYYREVLGGGEEAKRCALPSPFEQNRLCLLCANRVSTKYRDREDSLLPISRMLYELICGKRGNYLAYFPSYRYLQDVLETFQAEYPEVETLVQTASMDDGAREAFLLRFDAENAATLLGFCVLGGVFSEGVDLKGDRLIGTAVIGVGLPQIGPEPDLLRDYFNEKNGMGYAFAYRYPGMNKVLQAAGRVIRGTSDRGVVLLIDSRFSGREYQTLFPAHWSHWERIGDEMQLARRLSDFWRL